ncbi:MULTISPECIES: hypothetical protein [Halomonas]|uniref:hypothetical protein n=1 Tax=Halomonas TaxID=2745 RepID=UPI001C97FD3B|nr:MULTISPECIES: hypothetical protein [Halomonas]MBY6209364.1 hypothetical protein [Halomonas sp. DP3Y7-2]MBY6229519.1 hypothetical protein [Halomonas sp. DP3Y7-1]MCA0917422.1 hypothetical protein [Halomonas denitrificans]
MTGPLGRLINELGYPCLAGAELQAFMAEEGLHVLLLSGDPETNLETQDVAVILPELVSAFAGKFIPAVVQRQDEDLIRERFQVWPVPSLVFVEQGQLKGVVSRVRDWQAYLEEVGAIVAGTSPHAQLIARQS